ncbi:MAG: T9SS type A sorting domain-containing protein, partial [Candidatus Zixiibacteriota bacterium]
VPNFYGNTVDFIPIEVTSTDNIRTPNRINSSRNYPNPFNAYTVIEFNLSEPENVTLEIFDNLGRRIKALSNADYPAGEHSVIWDTEGLSSGIYFYRIKTDQYDQTRKMILLNLLFRDRKIRFLAPARLLQSRISNWIERMA